ncbi:tetratricopeptide repeat protein [Clostridium magnum]|uniref:Tetratricopeptide repeat protein n=1 Tax=Clostridium magnum DSM 2767 TaxID=1121326 RepID=A0A161XFC7_9CLOT|nr:tetratricopeptide repeat protein [Clostridium magnum]KZL93226.1 tetratricopeptide repeat protein [Clostridium magnum DSM 2767]SHI19422.1 Tetratricopeptide repeat-containing protein [Clostridium magnum DSM 2767]
MDKSKKLYVKALDKYNEGHIDKAIGLCEESISKDMKNSASINLKGLLCYLKGDLDSAQRLWKMNYGVNKDEVSQRYLEDTKQDKERLQLYIAALSLIKELKINEALSLLEQCEGSDFNCINVNNHIALCYIRIGEYNKALEYIEKVLEIDRNNSMSKQIMKTLRTYGDRSLVKNHNKINFKYVFIALIGLVILSSFFVIYDKFIKDNKSLNAPKESPKKVINKTDTGETKKDKVITNKEENEIFPSDKVKSDIENKNFLNLYEETAKWKEKSISDNDKIILSKANELLGSEGVEYFYNNGCTYMSSNDYNNAKTYLVRAYEIGQGSYLYPHIIYMTGSAFYSSGDAESAIKYYVQYDKDFSNGNYEDTVLYNLAIIYKDIDKSTAKTYAEKLLNNYPESIYSNSIIRGLVTAID